MWIVIRNDNEGTPGSIRQVGGPVKTGQKAQNLRQRMRQQQPLGRAVTFTVQQVKH